MNPLSSFLIALAMFIALIASVVALGYSYGHSNAANEYIHKLATANASLDVIDAQTKAKQLEYREDNEKLSQDYALNIDAINRYYRNGLPVPAKNNNSDTTTTECEQAGNGATAAASSDVTRSELEYQCAVTANTVKYFHAFIIKHGFPVGD